MESKQRNGSGNAHGRLMKTTLFAWVATAVLGLAQTYQETGGLVVMEMENTPSAPGLWQKQTSLAGYTGSGYLQFLGNTYETGPATSPLEYSFKINQAGLYYLHLHCAKETHDGRTDVANDCYVRVEGDYNAGPGPYTSHGNNASLSMLQSNTKYFGGATNAWKWENGQNSSGGAGNLDPGGETNKRVAVYDFRAGQTYKLVVSGRSKFFRINRIVFRHTSTAQSTAQNLSTPESALVQTSAGYTYNATTDFPSLTAGEVPYYKDNTRGALAIDASITANRGKYARASLTFAGTVGTYNATITSMKETDGECTYRLLINGVQVGTATNSPTANDYEPQTHTFSNVTIPAGATIAVESNTHSNGTIPEAGGFAWARGRWTKLELATSTSLVKPPIGRLAYVADGNSPDPDDIGANAVVLGLLKGAGLQDRLVHLSHSCDLVKASNISTADELRRQTVMHQDLADGIAFFGPFSNLPSYYNCRTDQTEAVNNLRDAINASSASDPLWIIEAGEPDIIGYALQAATASKRQFVHVVSHHPANDNSGDYFTWAQILAFGVTEHQIGDQNVGLQVPISSGLWDWAQNHSNPAMAWIWNRLKYAEQDGVVTFQTNKFDCSDAGMIYWWITGANAGGNKNSTPVEIRTMLLRDPYGPAAHWPLDAGSGSTAADATGNGYNGNLVNGPTWGSDATRASFVSFDGTDDRITTPFTYALGSGDDFTWAWWANQQSTGTTDDGAIMLGNRYPQPGAGGQSYEFIKFTPTQAQFSDTSDTATIEKHLYGSIAQGGWHHYAMVKSGTSCQWYVDGVATGPPVTINYNESSPIPFRIGGDDDGTGKPNEHFQGFIDDVVLYRRALTAAEINQVRNGNISNGPAVTALILVNADTDQDIGPISNGDTINFTLLGTSNLSVRAETSPATVGSVVFGLDGNPSFKVESVAPYTIAGDTGGDYNPWTPALGAHTLTATPYSAASGGGTAGTALTVNFNVVASPPGSAAITGELKKWHKVTLSWNGPSTSETAATNPFSDYRLNVTFSHAASGKSYTVPGYFAADGNAAETSAQAGNVWRVHFAPDETGTWTYTASFRTGTDVAASSAAGTSAGFFDGESGNFQITATDKTGRDLRGKGRLKYVGKHHLRFAETGEYFLKAGTDAPENFLAYDDFDDTPNDPNGQPNLRKSWSPHAGDYDAATASAFTWQGGKGTEILGAVRYLSQKGVNVFSFLTFSLDGDDDNVFPHRLKSSVAAYEAVADDGRWAHANGVHHDRFDVSKMDQWGRVFEYGTRMGMYLHFKTQETENNGRMDGGALGRERKLYYRELVARYGYNLALNWNLGEENTNTTAQQQAFAQWFYDNDPYRHHVVLHTYPAQKAAVYTPLLGSASKLTGLSMQGNQATFSDVFPDTLTWVQNSASSGVPWVVAYDEPGDAQHALRPAGDEGNSWTDGRKNALWGNVMAGGAGVEFYFGYQHAESDLTCQNFRSRDGFWNYCRHLLDFFRDNAVPFQDMANENALVSNADAWCLRKPGEKYVVYLKNGGTTNLNLTAATGSFDVRWFDPRNGGALQQGSVTSVTGGSNISLGQAPNSTTSDWVVYISKATTGGGNTLDGVMQGLLNDTDVRSDGGLLATNATTLVPGRSGASGGIDRSSIFVFQLPSLGNVANPFTAATLGFNVETVSSTPPGVNLYGLGKKNTADVAAEDYWGETPTLDPTDATLIQSNILNSSTGTGFKNSSASAALAGYLNTQYQSGAGAGKFVFLRLSTTAPISGLLRHFITSADAAGTNGPRVNYTAIAGNAAPTVTKIADRSLAVNAATGAIPFTIGDDQTAPASLILSKASSNPNLVPEANIVFGGSGANRSVTVTPNANQLGSSTISVTVSDGSLTTTDTFVLTVTGTASETWRFTHFGTTANTGTAADAFDANNDGENNLLEFATGQSPSANTLTTTPLATNGANLEFTYTRSKAAMTEGVQFAVEWTDSFGSWSNAGITEQIVSDTDTVQTIKATLAMGMGARRFMHLRVAR